MSTFKLLRAEIAHRKSNFLLSVLALVAAATLFVASPLLMNGYGRESNKRLDEKREQTEAELAKLRKLNSDDLHSMQVETAAKLEEMNQDTARTLGEVSAETAASLGKMQDETDAELTRMQADAELKLVQLDKRTKQIMRDLGFNLRIVHQNTDLSTYFTTFVSFDMPEEYIQRLADSPEITKIVHLVATLKRMIEWEGKPRLLVGFAPEATQSHIEKKPPMGFQIKRGTIYLGHVAGIGHKLDEEVEILGKKFTVARILDPQGNEGDTLIAMHLKDAQQLLEKEGKLTEILALGCKCKTADRIEEIRQQLQLVLPETQVTELSDKAIAREDQRKLVTAYSKQSMDDYVVNRKKVIADYEASRVKLLNEEKRLRDEIISREKERQQVIIDREKERQQHMVEREQDRHAMILADEKERQQRVLDLLTAVTNFILPMVILVCAVWVGFLAWSNVRERRTEIGLLRALGKRSGNVASLFLGRAIIVGLIGGVVGCTLGLLLACGLAVSVLDVSVESFQPSPQTLLIMILGAVLGTPLISAMASYLPTLSAISQDPAVVLMEN